MAERLPLVLLPGWSLPAGLLRECLAPHLPGQALLPLELPLAPGCTLDSLAGALLAQAPPRAHWLGWSLGGMVALQAALAAPGRVAAVVTLGTNLRHTAAPHWPCALPAGDLAGFAAGLAGDPAATLARFDALQCRGSARAREELRALRRLRAGQVADPDALAAGLAVLAQADLSAAVQALACPSLWLHGAADALVPAAAQAAILARCGRPQSAGAARGVIMPAAAHAPFLADPAAVAAPVRAFLESLS